MADQFQGHDYGLDSPARDMQSLTKNDSTDLSDFPRAILLSQDGAVRFNTKDGTTITVSLLGKVIYPIRISRLHNTGTDSGVTVYGLY